MDGCGMGWLSSRATLPARQWGAPRENNNVRQQQPSIAIVIAQSSHFCDRAWSKPLRCRSWRNPLWHLHAVDSCYSLFYSPLRSALLRTGSIKSRHIHVRTSYERQHCYWQHSVGIWEKVSKNRFFNMILQASNVAMYLSISLKLECGNSSHCTMLFNELSTSETANLEKTKNDRKEPQDKHERECT